QGRDLFRQPPSAESDPLGLDAVIRQERARVPLRRRLKERGAALNEARRQFEAGLAAQDGAIIGAALAVADPAGARRAPVRWRAYAEMLALWGGRLWEADDPYEVLEAFGRADPVPGAGLWLPAAVLHLKQPEQFAPWDDTSRQGYALLDDGADGGEPAVERYRLFNEGVSHLREQYRLHPLELPAVLAAVVMSHIPRLGASDSETARFGGFRADVLRLGAARAQHDPP